MSQNSLTIANASGAAVRAAINNALNTLVTLHSGATAPGTTFADMWWMDTTAGLLKIRNSANTAWVTVGVRDATNLGIIPSGTAMLFQQTSAPTGWTKLTTHDDKALRVVSGTVGSGGNDAFSTVFGAGKTTAGHTLTGSEMPSHVHQEQVNDDNTGSPLPAVRRQDGGSTGFVSITSSPGGGAVFQTPSPGPLNTASTGGGGSHSHNLTLDLQFVDLILASKD